jgi:hypothetical protein
VTSSGKSGLSSPLSSPSNRKNGMKGGFRSNLDDNDAADALYANGKIYVVAIVAAIVIAMLSVYVILIDRKVTKLEEKINQK